MSDNTDDAKLAVQFAKEHRPIRVFLSYASEDVEIARAFYESLVALKGKCGDNIRTVWDEMTFEIGSELRNDIEEQLFLSDYLFIIYTGVLKKSHSYTGAELGFYRGLIRADQHGGQNSGRKIIPIYFGSPPPANQAELGLNLQISSAQLKMPRDAYQAAVLGSMKKAAPVQSLTAIYQELAVDADSRLPPTSGEKSYSRPEWLNRSEERNTFIRNDIVPGLMLKLYDVFSTRVRRKAVEQKLITFKIGKQHAIRDSSDTIPDDTVLTAHGGAFSLFKVEEESDQLTWAEFKQCLQANMGERMAKTGIAAIERTAVSAVSPALDRDDDQILRTPDKMIYRLIVTKQLEFFDGSKLVDMYLIPTLRLAMLEYSKSAVTLRFIDVAVKYRDLFLNPASEVSALEFQRDHSFEAFRAKVQEVVRQLALIEDQSRVLGLDQAAAIAIYLGSSKKDQAEIRRLSKLYDAAKNDLQEAARAVRLCKGGDAGEGDVRCAWLAALDAFMDASNEVNSIALKRAIGNLQGYLFDEQDYLIEPIAIVAPPTQPAPAQPARPIVVASNDPTSVAAG
jgi:hypothetical protein